MKKIALFFASAAALMGAQAAQAVTYRPPGTHTFTGALTVSKGLTLSCTARFTVVVPNVNPDGHTVFTPVLATDPAHGHTATVTAGTLSGTLCGAVTLTGFPWTVTTSGVVGSSVTFNPVSATTITPGNCGPAPLVGTLTAPNSINFASATLPPGTPGTGNCVISGTITSSTFRVDPTP